MSIGLWPTTLTARAPFEASLNLCVGTWYILLLIAFGNLRHYSFILVLYNEAFSWRSAQWRRFSRWHHFMSCQFRRHFTMCLSTTSLAILLLLDFKPSTVPGKDCSWGASAYFAKSGPDKKFIRLGEVNIGVSLSMTGRSCHELRYVGTEQLSQVWLTDCFQPHQIATFSDMWYAAVSVDWQRPNSERVLTDPNLSETICRRQLPARFANDFSPNGKHHAKPSATSTPLTRSTSRGYIRAD